MGFNSGFKGLNNKCLLYTNICGPGSSVGIATGYGLDGPGRTRFSTPVQTGPGTHPASCTNGYRAFPGGKERPGRDADPSPLLVPWSRKSRAIPLLPLWAVRPVQSLSRAIPLLPLWAVWPVQSLSACTRGHFTFNFTFLRQATDDDIRRRRKDALCMSGN